MQYNWNKGEEIHKIHKSQKWTENEWKTFCENTFGFGSRNASDYEKLYLNFEIDSVPNSINAMKKPNNHKKLLDINDTHYCAYKCRKCHAKQNKYTQRKSKIKCINYLGGKCYICGAIDEPCIYDFHHKNPNKKDFKISDSNKFDDKVKKELDKCILLCCHCHRKIHASVL